jgi:hypothetical protein
MNLKLARLFLMATTVSLTAFSWPTISPTTQENNLSFKDFQIVSIKDREIQLKAVTDNAGVKQVTNITANIEGESLSFTIVVFPNDRNVELKYKGNIKLK